MELMIVVSLMAILAAVTIPSVVGVVGKSKAQAYKVDQRAIQAAVDTYYAEEGSYPTSSGSGGNSQVNDYYINMELLVTNRYLRNAPESASSENEPGATGSYTWYVDSNGRVRSWPSFTADKYP